MDIIEVKILGWEEYNPRKDYKKPWWFALSNRFLEDPKFYDFSAEERLAWIYILSQASQNSSANVKLNLRHANRACGISEKSLKSAILKLNEVGCTESVQNPNEICTESVLHTTEQNRTNRTEQNIATAPQSPPKNEIIAFYCDHWKSKNGKHPDIGGKSAGQLTKFEKDYGATRARELIASYFSMPDPLFIKRGYDVGTMVLSVNAIAQFESNGKIVTSELVRQFEKKIDKNQNTKQRKSIEELERERAEMMAEANVVPMIAGKL